MCINYCEVLFACLGEYSCWYALSSYGQYTLIRSVLKTWVLVIPREHNNPRERSSPTKNYGAPFVK